MKLKIVTLGIVTVMYLLFLLTTYPYDGDSRDVYGTGEQEWMMKNHLMLPSPNGADLNEKNFVTTKKGGFQSKKEYLFLQSLQTWRSNSEPGSNPEHNAVGPAGEKNFAGLELKKKRVLLLSLQKQGPVTSPGPNRKHNSIKPPPPNPSHKHRVNTFPEKNFASSELRNQHVLLPSLQKGGPVTSPGSNPGYNLPPSPSHKPVSTFSEKNFASSELRSQHVLLPSLQKGGPATSPEPNRRHNSIKPPPPNPSHKHPVSTFTEKNFASSELRSQHVLLPSLQKGGPVTSPRPNRGHNSIKPPPPNPSHKHPVSTFTEKNFASSELRNQHVLLPSLQKGGPVTSPGSNPGHNLPPSPSHKPVSTFSEKNFPSSELRSQHVLLPSLQKGGPVTSPGPNRGHDSIKPLPPNPSHNHPVSTFSEKNFASFELRNQHVLLPSLQKGGPVPSPGHNLPPSPSHKPVSTFSEKNFASSELRSQHVLLPSLQKGGSVTSPRPNRGHNSINPPPPNPSHNHPVSTFSEKNFASSELRNQHVLLPSLLKVGPVTPPGPNPGNNSAPSPSHNPVSTFSEKNFASFGLRSQHVLLPSLQKGPATSPGPNPGHHSISSIDHKNFAGLKMRKNHISLPSMKLRPITPP
ncbi:PREDICTED: formin-like protein 20 [Ipomoea nil]|uniref:formin-like protein 20 n=1 Tax=Ipomoea nil TaxID=35883 RepID=UPI0009012B8C|nr:PREDICTED: formin-like protein 20 [Ipomoea nil]